MARLFNWDTGGRAFLNLAPFGIGDGKKVDRANEEIFTFAFPILFHLSSSLETPAIAVLGLAVRRGVYNGGNPRNAPAQEREGGVYTT
ncbi:hypothetical protein [Argonema antarcticum]|uniref:hypothetical protein n=1 Tax=Argonema antarcticum TaxID=2942763 RepID=UPI00201178CA|nr:hypothetical protein [Argonema antarcticum]MCL1474732.1 hypothetical protein [Argonema antarcticum A004/B2]